MKLFRKATSRILPIAGLTPPPSSSIPILSACFSAWSLMVPAFLKGQSFDFALKTINGKNRKALKQNTLVCLFMTINKGRGKKRKEERQEKNNDPSPPPPPPHTHTEMGLLLASCKLQTYTIHGYSCFFRTLQQEQRKIITRLAAQPVSANCTNKTSCFP